MDMSGMNNGEGGAKRFVVDLAGAVTKGDLHDRIRRSLDLPAYYGENLDALYDLLTEMGAGTGTNARTEIIFSGAEDADPSLGEYLDLMRTMCRDAEEENPGLEIFFPAAGQN